MSSKSHKFPKVSFDFKSLVQTIPLRTGALHPLKISAGANAPTAPVLTRPLYDQLWLWTTLNINIALNEIVLYYIRLISTYNSDFFQCHKIFSYFVTVYVLGVASQFGNFGIALR